MPNDTVLLLTHSGDYFTIDRVIEALSRKGAKPFRLDTDQFPTSLQLAAYFDPHQQHHWLRYHDQKLDIAEVQAVWMRRLWQPKLTPELSPIFQESCIRESQAALKGFLNSLQNVRWVDPLPQIFAAEDKLSQLRLAKEVGLHIPRTLVTNDPEAARQFFDKQKGQVVGKLLTPLSTGMEGSTFFLYTSVVKEADLAEAENLRYSPMVFQQQIPKQQELRVIYVAGTVFAGSLDASQYNTTTIDWRRAQFTKSPWQTHELPTEIIERLHIFMAELGLSFGALDFIQTPNDEYVFLEINPTGEWGMLERDLHYPISEAIADALLSA